MNPHHDASSFGLRLSRRSLAVWLATVGVAASPASAATRGAESAALAALAERFHDAQSQAEPLGATLSGDNRFDDQLTVDIAPAERAKRFAMYRATLKQLQAVDRRRLEPADALTWDLLARDLRMRIGFERFHDHLMPIHQMGSLPVMLATFGDGQAEQPLATVAHHDAYLKRISQLPAWLAQAIVNLREGVRRRIVRSRPEIEAALVQLRPLGTDTLADNPFLAPIRKLPASFPAADRERLTAAYGDVVRTRIAPAVREMLAFIETDYLPVARPTIGWSSLPDGDAWYRHWLRDQTTSDLSPDAIHALGLKEVARLQAELARVAPKLGYEGDPKRLLTWVRTQEKFRPYRSEAQILDAYRAIDVKVKAKLPQLFGRMPPAPLDIRPEPELTKASASDHYAIPAEDGSRPGIFWAVINDPAAYDATTMVALFLHEGQPGHHFHLALQQQMPLPKFRKHTWVNAYGEGWALYAETLGIEMGLYEDPAAWVGALRMEIMRAARLVVDTGIHAKGWTRERAVAYWMESVGTTEAQAKNQIDRYIAWPAQALAYKLGSLKILELRERAQRRLGERFRLADFHDAVLADGSLPLSILEARIDAWIDTRRRA